MLGFLEFIGSCYACEVDTEIVEWGLNLGIAMMGRVTSSVGFFYEWLKGMFVLISLTEVVS